MNQGLRLPRLALARPAGHPLCDAVRRAGWEPVPYLFTESRPTGQPAPLPWPEVTALVALSPAGAHVASPLLPAGLACLVQGAGTAEALGRADLDIHLPEEPRAESLWDLLQSTYPEGGDFVLVRAERSRGFLESAARDTAWRLHAWITHAEAPLVPLPTLPSVEGVLALSPLQAEVLAPMARDLVRVAWGRATAEAFAAASAPATATCEPRPDALEALLSDTHPKEESPC